MSPSLEWLNTEAAIGCMLKNRRKVSGELLGSKPNLLSLLHELSSLHDYDLSSSVSDVVEHLVKLREKKLEPR